MTGVGRKEGTHMCRVCGIARDDPGLAAFSDRMHMLVADPASEDMRTIWVCDGCLGDWLGKLRLEPEEQAKGGRSRKDRRVYV